MESALDTAQMTGLPSPALVIDLDALDANIAIASAFFRSSPSKLRPHVKCHKSIALAKRQLAAGGTVGGVCVAKVSEAEVMVAGGITDVMIANEIVAPSKVERLAALARGARVSVFADTADNVELLSRVATELGVVLDVLVDVDTRIHRCGVTTVEEAVALAASIDAAPGLRLAGVNGYEGTIHVTDRGSRRSESERAIAKALEAAAAIRAAGLAVETVTAGGTSTWDIAGSIAGVTEVQAGGYLFCDADHAELNPEFRTALFIYTRVVARPLPGVLILDAGAERLSTTFGPPVAYWPEGLTIERVEPHFTWARTNGIGPEVGEPVTLIPAQCDMAINRFAAFLVIQGDRVVDEWTIDAGGHSQ